MPIFQAEKRGASCVCHIHPARFCLGFGAELTRHRGLRVPDDDDPAAREVSVPRVERVRRVHRELHVAVRRHLTHPLQLHQQSRHLKLNTKCAENIKRRQRKTLFTLAGIFLAGARNCIICSPKCEYTCKPSHKCH